MEERILLNAVSLYEIITAINNGNYYDLEIDELIITNNVSEKYNQIIIRPSLIDISDKILETIGDSKIKVAMVESEILEFICFTQAIDEEGKRTLLNQSLTEMILIDNSIMTSTGWKLSYFGNASKIKDI